jgi:hypothetical protein
MIDVDQTMNSAKTGAMNKYNVYRARFLVRIETFGADNNEGKSTNIFLNAKS